MHSHSLFTSIKIDAHQLAFSAPIQDDNYTEFTNSFFSIKGITVSQLSLAVLSKFCVTPNISGYRNTKRSARLLLLVLYSPTTVLQMTSRRSTSLIPICSIKTYIGMHILGAYFALDGILTQELTHH